MDVSLGPCYDCNLCFSNRTGHADAKVCVEKRTGLNTWKIKENIQVIQAPKISTLYEYLSPCVISYMLFG